MHRYQVICNTYFIASFMTEQQAETFVAERAKRYPSNEYRVQDSRRFA